jgi:hypothetical protein
MVTLTWEMKGIKKMKERRRAGDKERLGGHISLL